MSDQKVNTLSDDANLKQLSRSYTFNPLSTYVRSTDVKSTYQGVVVFPKEPVIDFASLYPSILQSYDLKVAMNVTHLGRLGLNPNTLCSPLNIDFDGDEINMPILKDRVKKSRRSRRTKQKAKRRLMA